MGLKKGNSSSFLNNNVIILILILLTVCILGGFIAYNFKSLKLFEKFENKPPSVVIEYYYMDNCSYCIAFDPIWTEFANTANEKYSVAKYNINDGGEGQKRAQKYNISGTPTIIATKNDVKIEKTGEYEGNRDLDSLVKFAKLNSA